MVEDTNKTLNCGIHHYSFGVFDQDMCIISDVKIAETVLTSNVELTKTADYDLLVPWTGKGLLMSSDKKWFQRRKVKLISDSNSVNTKIDILAFNSWISFSNS